ncbi:MAG TPA: sulfatase [Luteimonas sp.]|nr:sulfatase [Luteimonas sp.]HRO27557.1 sulfatase [Luteimonas sp.]HRP71860.1 sulfatase [Luteimonas sp.]
MTVRHNRREALKLLGGGALALSAAQMLGCAPAVVRPRSARRPNIVFIMTDDHAQSALGIYGNRLLRTPHLDRIGHEGLRFDHGFVTNALCLPSRATYLTGQYSHVHGMRTNGEESGFTGEPLLQNSQTWPNLLRTAGYHTGVVGKWHVNTPPEGYDRIAVLPGQGVYFDPPMLVDGVMRPQRGHTDDVIGDHALAFLRERPKDRPFALLYQFKAPHRGWEPAPRFERAFEDIEIPVPDSLLESLSARPEALRKADMRIADMPDFHREGVDPSLPEDERARRNFQIFIKRYYRVLLGVDENVGRVLDYLDQAGLAEDTIVVYTSDNGFFLGEHGLFDKRLMYEQSILVPMLLRWPGAVAAGGVERRFALNIDVAPTFLDLAGAAVPDTMQGTSWRPLLAGGDAPWRRDFMYQYYEFPAVHCVRPHRGVRDDRWKYIRWNPAPAEDELYDLQSDPDERHNLAGSPEHADELERLRGRLAQLRREYADNDPDDYAPTPTRPRTCPA